MAEKGNFLTPEGLAKLEEELQHLRTVRRQEVAEKIQKAKELRSTVSSPEYEDAKNEQGFVEGRILELERIIKNAVIIHPEAADLVQLGSKVTVRHQDGSEEHYTIVGSIEVNPGKGKISNESPVGKALLGKRVGNEVKVTVPAGVLKLTITEIK
ncbi:MAG: transcription elongation factor GreA [Chloroflexi bacterium]|jgi:transcription elongation factor GreA|nr:transcription elongation factor GreA [Chloroflexota bacterium]